MANFLLFLFAAAGMTMIIVDGSIMAPVRNLLKKTLPEKVYNVLECYQCTGFWSGMFCGFVLVNSNILIVFVCGCAGSAISSLWATYLNYLEAKSIIDLGEDEQTE